MQLRRLQNYMKAKKIIFFKIECREGLLIIVIKNHINPGLNIEKKYIINE